jgi:hypothetical protein
MSEPQRFLDFTTNFSLEKHSFSSAAFIRRDLVSSERRTFRELVQAEAA